jgi:chromosomal replication initiation ATPase DnaA
MEAIKLPAPNLTIVPDEGKSYSQLCQLRIFHQTLKAQNALLEEQNEKLKRENHRLQIALTREQDHVVRLQAFTLTLDILQKKLTLALKDITELVCVYKGISPDLLKTPSRKREYVYCRGLIYYLCSHFGTADTVTMGKFFGRDHSTVVNGRDDVKDKLKLYDDIKQDVRFLTKQIKDILR